MKPITFADIDTGPSWAEIEFTRAVFALANMQARETRAAKGGRK